MFDDHSAIASSEILTLNLFFPVHCNSFDRDWRLFRQVFDDLLGIIQQPSEHFNLFLGLLNFSLEVADAFGGLYVAVGTADTADTTNTAESIIEV